MTEYSVYRLWKMLCRWRWWFYLTTTGALMGLLSYPAIGLIIMGCLTLVNLCCLPITLDDSEVETKTAVVVSFWSAFIMFSINVGGVIHILQFDHQPQFLFWYSVAAPIAVLVHTCVLLLHLQRWGEEHFYTDGDNKGKRK